MSSRLAIYKTVPLAWSSSQVLLRIWAGSLFGIPPALCTFISPLLEHTMNLVSLNCRALESRLQSESNLIMFQSLIELSRTMVLARELVMNNRIVGLMCYGTLACVDGKIPLSVFPVRIAEL